MKAIIIFRRLKDWKEKLMENIIFSLMRQQFKVKVILDEQIKSEPVDLLIQFYCGHGSHTIYNEYNKCGVNKSIMIEKGWFDRDKHFLLYNINFIRYWLNRKENYMKFYKSIEMRPITRRIWVIMGQMKNDTSLIRCNNYKQWLVKTANFLKKYAKRPIYFRPHPDSGEKIQFPLDIDISRSIGIVSWNSSSVLKAMMHGIPVCVYDLPEIHNDKNIQIGLTQEWIEKIETETPLYDYSETLKWIAGQQLSIDEFSTFNWKGLMGINEN